jgi:hypothetical protein
MRKPCSASELDTNIVERAIRPVTLGRKNHLFAGSDGGARRWATVCSLITTAKPNDVEPFAYLRDVLERMSNGTQRAVSTTSCSGTGGQQPPSIDSTCKKWTLTQLPTPGAISDYPSKAYRRNWMFAVCQSGHL